MALFYSDKPQPKQKTAQLQAVSVQSLDYQGLGVAKLNGKTWFIENALPQEVVNAVVLEEKRQYGRAKASKILTPSAHRATPSCPLYGQCGGCQMQHIPLTLQRETKQAALLQRLQKLQVQPIELAPMLQSADKGYRRRAKLSLLFEHNQLKLGFRQANTQQIISVSECEMLEPALSALLPKLQQLFADWKSKKQLGHLELVQTESGITLFLRHLGALSAVDAARLRQLAEAENLALFVMAKEDQLEHWHGSLPYYELADLTLGFSVRDFIQVNAALNRAMVQQATAWLALEKHDRVLDLFCGMGNFTLPMAQQAGYVVGIEGVAEMVIQARENATQNGIRNVAFYQTDLSAPFISQPWAQERFNKVLLDPARNGALFALDHLCQLQPGQILYISCNPATLVRDAEKLLQAGYRLQRCAMIDMFPHTAHLESMSLFVKN